MMIRSQNRGFAMLAALGVLAVLMMVVMAAANCVDLTYSFNEVRASDKRVSDAIRQAAELLAGPQKADLEKAGQTVALTPATAKDDVEVSATIGVKFESPIAARDGDVGVLLSAARKDGRGVSRKTVCLLNSKGARQSPIVLNEERR